MISDKFTKKDQNAGGLRAMLPRPGQFFRYTHMPQILPRIRAMGSKFGHIAFMLALVFRSARLLPAGHPMINVANIGRYGIRDVIATAANGLVMRRENLDQILIFGAVMMAVIMIAVQAVLIGIYAFMGQASAADTGAMFTTPNPNTDLAFQFLRNVFGVPGVFGTPSANDTMVTQSGLHAVMGFYSTGMMIIAVMIVIYYVITTVGESAQSGKPFGRMNTLWAPIRLVLALGLLVPLGGGLNAAQYLTLYVAKLGSSLATNAWIVYIDKISANGTAISTPPSPDVQPLALSVFAAEACREMFEAVKGTGKLNVVASWNNKSAPASFTANDVSQALQDGAQQMQYVWTQDSPGGAIRDTTCGSVAISLPRTTGSGASANVRGAMENIQNAYFAIVGDLVRGMRAPAQKYREKYISAGGTSAAARGQINIQNDVVPGIVSAIEQAQNRVNSVVSSNATSSTQGGLDGPLKTRMQEDAQRRGWASAGIHYIHIAKTTQAVYSAASAGFPEPVAAAAGTRSTYDPAGFTGWVGSLFWSDSDKEIKTGMQNLHEVAPLVQTSVQARPLQEGGGRGLAEYYSQQSGPNKAVTTVIDFLFGSALLNLVDQPTLDPMTKMIQAGMSLMDRAEKGIYIAIGASVMGSGLSAVAGGLAAAGAAAATGVGIGAAPVAFVGGAVVASAVGALFKAVAPLAWFIVGICISAGIILFYILPLLPFMYFFLSITSWMIEVLEAFVCMPLWALAHLRIDGDGMPGSVAMKGYMTLFGILLRPLLIIVGLIVAMLIFGAGTTLLNAIYRDVVLTYRDSMGASNAGVFNQLTDSQIGPFGFLVYVIIYVYIVYVFAISSFKLMDMIPDKAISRWLDAPSPFTGDKTVDPGSMTNAAIAGYTGLKGAAGAFQGSLGQIKQVGQDVARGAARGASKGAVK